MNEKRLRVWTVLLPAAAAVLSAAAIWILWTYVPRAEIRYALTVLFAAILFAAAAYRICLRRQVADFADTLCGILDGMIAGGNRRREIYEDSLTAKVQSKLLQFYDIAEEAREESRRDKQTIQELVSDISHQVKTPMANLKIFTGILKEHSLSEEKQKEFLETMEGQIGKLDFLMQSLIKMSRLETGTFALHPEKEVLEPTVARAISLVWTAAERKRIRLETECDSSIEVIHDPKWTAEALGNILDNAVKYTPPKGSIRVQVRPWQIYTRIDISDTGIGIAREHYHDIFKRFYRAEEAAKEEGVGLGLYLAQEIIRQERGYITVQSEKGQGTVFSVFLLS